MLIKKITTDKGLAMIYMDKQLTTAEVKTKVTCKKTEINSWEELDNLKIKDKEAKEAIIQAICKKANYKPDIFGPIKQVPRPITTFIENNECIFGTFSLDTKSITKAIWANEQIYKACNNKLFSFKKEVIQSKKTTQEILEQITQATKKITDHTGFTLKIAIICKQPVECKKETIEKYNIAYIENPKDAKEITEQVKHCCFIATKKGTNAIPLKADKITDILQAKAEKLTIFSHIKNATELHITAGCNVPVIRYAIDNKEVPKAMQELEHKIRTSSN